MKKKRRQNVILCWLLIESFFYWSLDVFWWMSGRHFDRLLQCRYSKTRMTSPSRSAWQGILHLLRLRKRRNFWTHRKPPRVLIHLTWSSLNCLNFQCSNFPKKTKGFIGILDFGWFQGLWTPSNHFCRKVINIFFFGKKLTQRIFRVI